ncbi:hypothetical protein KCU77_g8759, partial [Aureobasidium melanogenum]
MARGKLLPCFFDANGDVVISMLTTMSSADPETTDLRISGQRPRAVSPNFEANLKPEWLHNKVTGEEICSDGTTLTMKRFELELDSDGGDFLVGEVDMLLDATYTGLQLTFCTQARLAQFIRPEVPPIAIQKFTLLYLRIACVLRDKSLFDWILDKNPLFSNNIYLNMSSMDCRLGIGLWASVFERHLNFLGSVLGKLRNLPDRIPPFIQDRFRAEEWKLILYVRNSWLVDLAAEKRAKYQNVDPSMLALLSIATSDFVFPLHSFLYTPVVAQHANHYLQHALIQAKGDISQHITIDESEPIGFWINSHDFFSKYGYPWDYRLEEDTNQALFDMIATKNLSTRDEDFRSGQQEVSNPIIHGF